jgi:hypothetical protein
MGIHFVNLTVSGPPDPMRPNVLIYEPVGGKLRLVAAEWLVPLVAAKERPMLLGQPFQGPMEGHEPLIPKEFAHYDLLVWLFKENPLGTFSPTNPDVSCEGYGFRLLEGPTKLVPEPLGNITPIALTLQLLRDGPRPRNRIAAILDGIGSTEMLHIFISAHFNDRRPGATGRPVAGWGGGDPGTGHCCPGECPTVELIQPAARILAGKMRYEVPEQDLSIGARRMPALPKSGFVMRNVSFEDERH